MAHRLKARRYTAFGPIVGALPHLLAIGLQDDGGDQAMHSPVKTNHALHRAPIRKRGLGNLDDEIEHGDPTPICSHVFSEGGSHA